MKKFALDFKKFIMRGNVLDLAVAVIIGAAFGRIVQSLVKDILMPITSLVFGQKGFENYKYVITPADLENGIAENAINYGIFLQNIIDFVIVAFVIFIIIRLVNRAQEVALAKKIQADEEKNALAAKQKAEIAAIEAQKPKVEDLLSDIKALLEKKLN
jgi:large conductance mechanosensitive channel